MHVSHPLLDLTIRKNKIKEKEDGLILLHKTLQVVLLFLLNFKTLSLRD
jgi:hypothetical protein